jgi:hypothetical protein
LARRTGRSGGPGGSLQFFEESAGKTGGLGGKIPWGKGRNPGAVRPAAEVGQGMGDQTRFHFAGPGKNGAYRGGARAHFKKDFPENSPARTGSACGLPEAAGRGKKNPGWAPRTAALTTDRRPGDPAD